MPPGPGQSQQGKDLKDFQKLPRSPVLSYMQRAAGDQKRFNHTLKSLDPRAIVQWVTEYLGSRIGRRHKFEHYDNPSQDNGVYNFGDESTIGGQPDSKGQIRLSIAGDWGTGTDEAFEVAAGMSRFNPHFTVHLGDVYYVGKKDEVEENCLGQRNPFRDFKPCLWPLGSVGSFAMNGNHEMYARGYAYFDDFLPRLGMRPAVGAEPKGQKASFFSLQNKFWNIIALDTGYNSIGFPVIELLLQPSCKLRTEQLHWLEQNFNLNNDGRGVILLTHHQYCSSFDFEYPKIARQLSKLIDRPVLWIWGHEHRMAVYGKFQNKGGITAFGRCIGHGGMPVEINPKFKRDDRPLVAYDNRLYPNNENITVGYNGYANLTFVNDHLVIEYRDLYNNLLLTDNWHTSGGNLTGHVTPGPPIPDPHNPGVTNPGLTKVRDWSLATP